MFTRKGYSDIDDFFFMSVTVSRSCQQNHFVGDFLRRRYPAIIFKIRTSQNCHQNEMSPTSVANIDEAMRKLIFFSEIFLKLANRVPLFKS